MGREPTTFCMASRAAPSIQRRHALQIAMFRAGARSLHARHFIRFSERSDTDRTLARHARADGRTRLQDMWLFVSQRAVSDHRTPAGGQPQMDGP